MWRCRNCGDEFKSEGIGFITKLKIDKFKPKYYNCSNVQCEYGDVKAETVDELSNFAEWVE